MIQERLSDLVIISIENEICENLDYGDLIATFWKQKRKKLILFKFMYLTLNVQIL